MARPSRPRVQDRGQNGQSDSGTGAHCSALGSPWKKPSGLDDRDGRVIDPLFIAVILLTTLLPQLQSLKLAGLQAETRDTPDVWLPTSPSVVLPLVTEFAAVAQETIIDAVDVSDLVGTSSTPLGPSGERRLMAISNGLAR